MPEGDVVWRTAAHLHEALADRTLVESDFRVPRIATVSLVGQVVTEVVARGKHLLARTSGGHTLHTHLRMDGRWQVGATGQARRRGPWHEIRVVLANADHEAVGFRLPVVELLRTVDEPRTVGHLGPDLLGPDWNEQEAVRRLSADPARTIGEALIDQRNLAGIGTIYRSESCFVAGVSPHRPAGDVADLEALVAIAHRQLAAGAADPRPGTTGDRRGRYWVYGRKGLPCRRCGTVVQATQLGPAAAERIAYWCPRCQPG